MKLYTVYDFYKELENDALCFVYQGSFEDDITDMLISLSENNIVASGNLRKMRRRVSFLMAECFQNIVRHGENVEKEMATSEKPGFFMTRNHNDEYYITSANLIENDQIDDLRRKLENVNTSNKAKLKQLYMQVMANEGMSEKGGAGLGLIEMARKSGQKIEFVFEEYNDTFSYFYLQIKLRNTKERTSQHAIPVSYAKDMHQRVNNQNIILIHKDNFSQEAIKPVLKMVENNMNYQGDDMALQKITFHILVEVLQNLGKHALLVEDNRPGIFMMGKQGESYYLNSGNFVLNDKVEHLEKRLKLLNSLNRTELKDLYKRVLKDGKETEGGGAGLGLIDIARESNEKIKYDFIRIDNEKTFFALNIKL